MADYCIGIGTRMENIDLIHYGMFPNIGYNGDIHCDVTNHGSIKPIIMELRICYIFFWVNHDLTPTGYPGMMGIGKLMQIGFGESSQ